MSLACLILGESGTGKTCSLRNLHPAKTLLIQPIRKPLPFPSKGWTETGPERNIYVTSEPEKIVKVMEITRKDIIVIDDYQYVLSFKYMHEGLDTKDVYRFFRELGKDGFGIAEKASQLAQGKRVYILAHTDTDAQGCTRIKTLGKMLDEKIVLEGMFTTVLRTTIDQGRYGFRTTNSGRDTVKSPMGMFEDEVIENDLAAVDARICEYYGIENPNNTEEKTE